MTQIGVEAATLIPPLVYRAVMMVVIAIPVVVGAVLVRTARPVHPYQSKTTPVAVGFGCWLVWAQHWSVGCAVATAFHGAQSLELCSRYHSRLRCWWESLLWCRPSGLRWRHPWLAAPRSRPRSQDRQRQQSQPMRHLDRNP